MGRRRLVLRSGDEVIAEVQRLTRDGCRPLGTWDLPRTVWHLTESMEQSVHGKAWDGPRGWKRVVGRMLLPLVLAFRRIPAGAPAPAPLLPPETPAGDLMPRFEAGVRLVEEATAFIAHPVFGAMTPEQWRALHWIHAAHHLGHLAPTGPGSSGR